MTSARVGAEARRGALATIQWRDGRVRLLDQRALPGHIRYLDCTTVDDLVDAIRSLAVRGAPALGAAGAYGVALAAHTLRTRRQVRAAADRLVGSRPTAVNLASGVAYALSAYETGDAASALDAAEQLARDDIARNRAIGAHGAPLLAAGARVLTHCNTGALACVGYGTALGVIRTAAERGRDPRVWVDETRPLLQGARLTMFELERLGIDATLIVDSAAASLMAADEVDLVILGADRIAANGDVANKVGTYALAVLARHHGIPFYVAAPTSTIDLATADGDAICIEERDPDEVRTVAGRVIAPAGCAVRNPAFDVTPALLVTAIVTEVGVARRPYARSLPSHVRRASSPSAPT
ncbi:MAG: S-methyl-5-thioribose-1-phosphate isomerase [Acidimicrobiia bacterium]